MAKLCKYCGAAMEDNEKFCSDCGKLNEDAKQRVCPSCGAAVENTEKFCSECGALLDDNGRAATKVVAPPPPPAAQPAVNNGTVNQPAAAPAGTSNNNTNLIIGAVAGLLLLAGGAFFFMNGNKEKDTKAVVNNGGTKVTSKQNKGEDRISIIGKNGVINGNDVNVRKGPGTSNQSIGVFFKNDVVRIVDEVKSSANGEVWYKVEYNNPTHGLISGYVLSRYIDIRDSADAPFIHMGAIVGASESSSDREGNVVYSARRAIDGDLATCWAEGVRGLGEGEFMKFDFNGTYKISGLSIAIGHQKSQDLFYKNARPASVRIIGSDGSNKLYAINDKMGYQTIRFLRPINVNWVKVIVEDIYRGDKYEDTCVAEVQFY